MQFGIFSVGDVTPDPTTGLTLSEGERIALMTRVALKAEEVGLDVFATGEHHNPPFVVSAPTTHLAYIAAKTERLLLSTSTTRTSSSAPARSRCPNSSVTSCRLRALRFAGLSRVIVATASATA